MDSVSNLSNEIPNEQHSLKTKKCEGKNVNERRVYFQCGSDLVGVGKLSHWFRCDKLYYQANRIVFAEIFFSSRSLFS